VDGDPVSTWLNVNVRIYDKCVLDEFGQRVDGQEIGREYPTNVGTSRRARLISSVYMPQKSVVMFLSLSI
jgi:hypothetical protein